MTTIDKIRADIIRRITDNTFGAKLELMDILSFLDTLEEPVSEDLEEAAEKYADLNCHNHVENETDWSGLLYAFKAGAEWMKAKMMEGAEDCELYWDGDFLAIDLNMQVLGYSERDKVKIIVVKEDEK